MAQNILLTGAFGNVGQNTLKQLLTRRYNVTCFDLQNPANEKSRAKLAKEWNFKTIWGNILEKDDIDKAIKDIDCIIHLAAIIPPLSEQKPELTKKVNIEGTRNLINAVRALPNKPKFIIASSMSVYGPTMHLEPPVKVDTPLNPSDHYSHTKVECERMLKESGLPWTVLRLGAVSVDKFPLSSYSIIYEVPLDQRIEFVSSIDCGIAFANAVKLEDINKVFLIGGGAESQLVQRDFLKGFFDAFGLPMLPDKAFRKPAKTEEWFYIDWMDTKESQEVLNFQTEPFQKYIEKMKRKFRLTRFALKIIGPLVKFMLVKLSPYSKKQHDTTP